jgi:hypothetical protein
MSDARSERPLPIVAGGTRVGFELSSAPGCAVLTLEDGAVLYVHPIVLDVARLPGTNEQGEPLYSVSAGLAIRLMKPPTDGGIQ